MAAAEGGSGREGDQVGSLIGPLRALLDLLERSGVNGVVIGGIAASLLGKPRYTADVDAVVLLSGDLDDLERFVEQAVVCGLTPRHPDALAFARRNRVLLLKHDISGVPVDISLGLLPFEIEAIERANHFTIGSITIPIPTPEDLIIMKAVAHRPRDLEDIRAIIAANPDLDRDRIRLLVGEFAAALEMPEIWDDIAPLI